MFGGNEQSRDSYFKFIESNKVATRYLIVVFTAKGENAECSYVRGYKLKGGAPIPSYEEIRNGCLEWVNKEGDNFYFFSINFMQFVDEADYNSFMGVEDSE